MFLGLVNSGPYMVITITINNACMEYEVVTTIQIWAENQ